MNTNNTLEHCMCVACRDGVIHASDCAVHNEPAYPNGPCNCAPSSAGEWVSYCPEGAALNPEQAAFICGPVVRYMGRSQGFSVEHARLMAAAPELLSVLQEVVVLIPDAYETKERALAAIQKATGASHVHDQ